MSTLVINAPTMSCCGRSRGECRCGERTTNTALADLRTLACGYGHRDPVRDPDDILDLPLPLEKVIANERAEQRRHQEPLHYDADPQSEVLGNTSINWRCRR